MTPGHEHQGKCSWEQQAKEFVVMLCNPRFSDIHSSQKEKHLSISLEASNFVKLQLWLVLRCPLTVQERWGILESGFWQIVTRSNVQMKFGPKFTDLHSSPKERQLQKSCVSFGEECTYRYRVGQIAYVDRTHSLSDTLHTMGVVVEIDAWLCDWVAVLSTPSTRMMWPPTRSAYICNAMGGCFCMNT